MQPAQVMIQILGNNTDVFLWENFDTRVMLRACAACPACPACSAGAASLERTVEDSALYMFKKQSIATSSVAIASVGVPRWL